MRLRCTTEAWLYRLADRENSAASVTHGFGAHDHTSCDGRDAQRPGLRCRGNISPHLAPLFPARRPEASAPERATYMDVRQQLRGRGYASSEVQYEALVDCG